VTSAKLSAPASGLFGTDGVRGVAGERVTAELALSIARAATELLDAERPQVLVLRDTRESGPMLQAAVAAGVAAAGGDAFLAGVLPTPAASLLVRQHELDLAIVLSASHNPYQDNGIKLFGADGMKLSDDVEAEIEAAIEQPPAARRGIGRVRELRGAAEDYVRELHERYFHLDLAGANLLLDCANGATHQVAPALLRRLGARVTAIGHQPDGRNINAGCGSTHVDRLGEAVRDGGHDLGFAFDGDGDRVLAADRTGAVVDGDDLIALAALHLRDRGRLPGNGVAITVMTNYGFHVAMEHAGIEVATTPVGDRNVLDELLARGWAFGGEQSGHVIDLDFNATGDGLATALLTLEALGGGDLAERRLIAKLPQRLVNVTVTDPDALLRSNAVQDAIAGEAGELEGRGRVLVRASGTEPLVRVMVEAPTDVEVDAVCGRLVAAVEAALG